MKTALFLLAVAVLGGCAGQVVSEPEATTSKAPSVCSAYGEAPYVTTIRAPVMQPPPHPDCVELEELSAAGQKQYCCMGPAFDAWYSGAFTAQPNKPCVDSTTTGGGCHGS